MKATIETLRDQLQEREARLEVVEDILSFEKNTEALRAYRRERSQLVARIATLKREINTQIRGQRVYA